MISIKKGPTVTRYAECYGCNPDEVVEWINEYIQVPTENREATEEERKESILGYVKAMIECSTYGRIKRSIENARRCD